MVSRFKEVMIEEVFDWINSIVGEVSKVIIGKRDIIEVLVCALFTERHVLIEGYPGTGKTLLVKSLARTFGGLFGRVQGNPDILPSDITGFHVYSLDGKTRFIKGPVFANIVMIDEINRITPRAQSALLEALQEFQVTVDGVTYRLPRPFMVVATQIPLTIETGVYLLTETLKDRFAVSLFSDYNDAREEFEIIKRSDVLLPDYVESIIRPGDVIGVMNAVRKLVHVDDRVVKYIDDLVNYIRHHDGIVYGPSHRASIDLFRLSRVYATYRKRDYVIPDDIKYLAKYVIPHRVRLAPEAEAEGLTTQKIVEEALSNVEVPKM